MIFVLAGDETAAAHPRVLERMKAAGETPRIAWIASDTATGLAGFAAASASFRERGFENVEYCDIDEERDEVQLAFLYEFDIVYLSDGDPLPYRYNMLRTGLSGRLRQCANMGRLVVAAGGGALLLTPNVSLYRLRTQSVDEVLADRGRFDGLGTVAYEFLPHRNRWDADFLDRVQRYSARVDTDIVAVADGSLVLPATERAFEVVGDAVRYRNGVCEVYTQSG